MSDEDKQRSIRISISGPAHNYLWLRAQREGKSVSKLTEEIIENLRSQVNMEVSND